MKQRISNLADDYYAFTKPFKEEGLSNDSLSNISNPEVLFKSVLDVNHLKEHTTNFKNANETQVLNETFVPQLTNISSYNSTAEYLQPNSVPDKALKQLVVTAMGTVTSELEDQNVSTKSLMDLNTAASNVTQSGTSLETNVSQINSTISPSTSTVKGNYITTLHTQQAMKSLSSTSPTSNTSILAADMTATSTLSPNMSASSVQYLPHSSSPNTSQIVEASKITDAASLLTTSTVSIVDNNATLSTTIPVSEILQTSNAILVGDHSRRNVTLKTKTQTRIKLGNLISNTKNQTLSKTFHINDKNRTISPDAESEISSQPYINTSKQMFEDEKTTLNFQANLLLQTTSVYDNLTPTTSAIKTTEAIQQKEVTETTITNSSETKMEEYSTETPVVNFTSVFKTTVHINKEQTTSQSLTTTEILNSLTQRESENGITAETIAGTSTESDYYNGIESTYGYNDIGSSTHFENFPEDFWITSSLAGHTTTATTLPPIIARTLKPTTKRNFPPLTTDVWLNMKPVPFTVRNLFNLLPTTRRVWLKLDPVATPPSFNRPIFKVTPSMGFVCSLEQGEEALEYFEHLHRHTDVVAPENEERML